ncbi:MAG: DUF1501 domain-containing protein [Planctomycetota bacterium]
MNPSRRELLKVTASLPLLALLPSSLRRAAALAGPPDAAERVLVVVQLTGGNDGLNTVVPWADDRYHAARPVLAVPRGTVLKLDEHYGLHPALGVLQPLWEQGQLAHVQGVGCPQPNRSHFRSLEIWHTARTEETPPTLGWLGAAAAQWPAGPGLPLVRVGERDLPLALAGASSPVPALASLEDLEVSTVGSASKSRQRALLRECCQRLDGRAALSEQIARAYEAAFDCAQRLQELHMPAGAGGFPPTDLGRALRLAAQLIGARLGSRVLYATQGGFDTHAGQGRSHPALLRELAGALSAFQEQITLQGDAPRVLTVVFSEFGRRVHENASGGTDHGAGNPVLLLGSPVRGGAYGPRPDLSGALDEDVPVSLDFRRVYATACTWLGLDSSAVLPERFEALPLLA